MIHFSINNKYAIRFVMIITTLLLASCGTMQMNISNRVALPCNTRIVIGPLANNSSTPLANRQTESMIFGIMRAKGFRHIVLYPRKKTCEKLLYCADEGLTQAQLVRWARSHHVQYVLTGSTNEWGYKVGLDGEPVVGVSLNLINATSGKVEWSAVGSAIGSSRSGLDVTGQTLLNNLLKTSVNAY